MGDQETNEVTIVGNMMIKFAKKLGIAASLCMGLVVAPTSHAVPMTFFGEDLGQGEGVALASTPNSDAAQASFLAGLMNPGVETFEGIAPGTNGGGGGFGVGFANGVTATISGGSSIQVRSLPDGTTNGFGRYGVTGDGDPDERYLDTGGGANAFTIDFSAPVAAFGFFGIDIGDFNGTVTATTSGGLSQLFDVGNSTNIAGGSVLFFGIIDPMNTFTSVSFGNTGSGSDVFGFDDFTIGTAAQVVDPGPGPGPVGVSEPSSLLLMLVGLAGLMLRRRLSA